MEVESFSALSPTHPMACPTRAHLSYSHEAPPQPSPICICEILGPARVWNAAVLLVCREVPEPLRLGVGVGGMIDNDTQKKGCV